MDHYPLIVENQAPGPADADAQVLHWPDEAATQAFARALAEQPGLAHAFITLHGDLGAGKTTLARHLLQALGVEGRIKSPTYAIVETYETRLGPAAHFDFYRFNDPQEWEDAGFRDLFASPGLKLTEWPQKAGDLLPQADMDIHIDTAADTSRSVALKAHTALGAELLQGLRGSLQAGGGA